MARLECAKCRCVYHDVARVKKCPLCGGTEFRDTSFNMGIIPANRWFKRDGNLGFFYYKGVRLDDSGL